MVVKWLEGLAESSVQIPQNILKNFVAKFPSEHRNCLNHGHGNLGGKIYM
jgi:hypothetical protein